MAAAGPAMEVVGRYSEVLDSRGEPVDIHTFLPLARAAVQEAMAVRSTIVHSIRSTLAHGSRSGGQACTGASRKRSRNCAGRRWPHRSISRPSETSWTGTRVSRSSPPSKFTRTNHSRFRRDRCRPGAGGRIRARPCCDGRGACCVAAATPDDAVPMGGDPVPGRPPSRLRPGFGRVPPRSTRTSGNRTQPRRTSPRRCAQSGRARTSKTARSSCCERQMRLAGRNDRMSKPTPWWKALKLRQEILDASGQIDDVQMSLFQAVHGTGVGPPGLRGRRRITERSRIPPTGSSTFSPRSRSASAAAMTTSTLEPSPASIKGWGAGSRTPASARFT